MRVLLAVALTALIAAPAPARTADPTTASVKVFAASSMKEAIDDAAAHYTAQKSVEVRSTFASSADLAQKIDKGAPADLFISADTQWMDWAAKHGRIDPATRRNIASNRLVLIAPKNSRLKPFQLEHGAQIARLLGRGRLAVGDVTSVPAGKYAKASLISLGLWEGVKGKLAQGENDRAALAFVVRGEAPLGIVYFSDVQEEPKVKVVAVFPAASHPPIVYAAAVVHGARKAHAASGFLDFLGSLEGQAILTRHGFGPSPK